MFDLGRCCVVFKCHHTYIGYICLLSHVLILRIELWKSISYQWHKAQVADKI